MVTITNGVREKSASPANATMNGGVAVPSDASSPKLHDVERAANAYKPYHAGMPAVNSPTKLNGTATAFKPTGGIKVTPMHFLNRDSTADDGPLIVSSTASVDAKHADKGKQKETVQQPVGTQSRTATISPQPKAVFFTTDVGSEFHGCHYLKVEHIPKKALHHFLQTTQMLGWEDKVVGMHSSMSDDGLRAAIYVCFDDLRDASKEKVDLIEMVQTPHPVSWASQPEYMQAKNGHTPSSKTCWYDGQVVFVATYEGETDDSNIECIAEAADKLVHTLAEQNGDTRAMSRLEGSSWPCLEFRVEYYKITDAKSVLEKLTKDNLTSVEGWTIHAKTLEGKTHDVYAAYDGRTSMQIATTPHRNRDGTTLIENKYISPTGRSAWTVDENGKTQPAKPLVSVPKVGEIPFGVPMMAIANSPYRGRYHSDPLPQTPHHSTAMMTGAYMGPRSGSWGGYQSRYSYSHGSPRRSPITGPQAVVIANIRGGTDVRTTIMLRNIPNRMNCFDLKQVLDKKTKGLYDFSYLRIDFQKSNNVGYAFVNFEDPESIAIFCQEWLGKRWVPGNPRCVELSYATVQGYDCLVEKFRNSAIMDEYPMFRPKLWYTVNTAPVPSKIGEEIEFPKPNNMSKHQRSHDNAGQLGLYPPRSGQMTKERGRRSQYDRGTPAQITEESWYQHQQQQQISPLHNGYGYMHSGFMHPGYYGPRIMGPPPPPQFQQQIMYGNGYENAPGYMMQGNGFQGNGFQGNGFHGNGFQGNGFMPAWFEDPFGPATHNGNNGFGPGAYNGGYSNANSASHMRTLTNGKLGGRPKQGSYGGPVQSAEGGYYGGPVQSPDGGYYGGPVQSPEGGYYDGGYRAPMPKVVELDEQHYNN